MQENAVKILIYTDNEDNTAELIRNFVSDFIKKYNIKKEVIADTLHINNIKNSIVSKYDFCFKMLSSSTNKKDGYANLSWTYESTLLNIPSNINKNTNPSKKSAQIISVGRAGTMFFHSILKTVYKDVYPHATINRNLDLANHSHRNDQEKIFATSGENTPIDGQDIFYIYRDDWLGLFTSHCLGQKIGFFHQDNHDYSKHDKIKLNIKQELLNFTTLMLIFFNALCTYRVLNPNKFIAILKFEDNVRYYGKIANHEKINYGKNKSDLFQNWSEIEKGVEKSSATWNQIRANALDKLRQMGVPHLKNLDEIV